MKINWVEHNQKLFGSKITALEEIIKSQLRNGGKSDGFISDMYLALKAGRKITPKMEKAIDNIIKRNEPEQMVKREKWVNSVVPKINLTIQLCGETNWSGIYIEGKKHFLESVKKQAMTNMRLSRKQMDCVSKIYNQAKKNINKKKKFSPELKLNRKKLVFKFNNY